MKPLSETARFPRLNCFLVITASFLLSLLIAFLIGETIRSTGEPIGSSARIWRVIQLIITYLATTIVGTGILSIASIFIINHLSGRYVIGDDNTSSRDVFADAYSLSTHYVLPYAYNGINKQNDPYCELHLSFSYTEIFDAYQSLKKHHRLVYYFRTLSLPNHLGRRRPLLTRAGAKRLLQEMTARATTNGEDIRLQRAILCYTFFPSYSPKIALPEHQAFISRDVIRDLLYLINPDRNQPIPDGAEVTASYDAGLAVVLSATYLYSIFSRIAAEDELVYLPIQE